jgi:trans-2,3-dihydro-3-hydroxyanthranilate isomerase
MKKHSFSLVEVFATHRHEGATVVVFPEGEALVSHAQRMATTLGASAVVLVLPPRREDCTHRIRVFTPTRELPLSAKGAIAAAEVVANGDTIAFEQGVIATLAQQTRTPDGASGWSMPVDSPVINGRAIEDRALVCSALGLEENELVAGLPVQSVSCGWLSLAVPVRSSEILAKVAAHPVAWQRVIEKAKPYGTAVFVPTAEGEVPMRFVVTRAADDMGTGLACASVAEYLRRFGVRTSASATITQATSKVYIHDGKITGNAMIIGEGVLFA